MPNSLAYLMLMIWPIFAIVLFRKLPAPQAFIWTLLGGYLLLPAAPAVFDYPLLPPFDKHMIPNLVVTVICLAMFGRGILTLPQSYLGRALVALFVLSPIATVLTNGDPIEFRGQVPLPALRLTDAFALSVTQMLLLFPFLLARQLLANPDNHKDLLFAIFAAGLVYSFPILIEIRLSPQLNAWIYGYYQHSFAQTIRASGFRPVVFLNHGLWLAFFVMTALIAGLALWRAKGRDNRTAYFLASGYLGAILFLCKSLGAFVYGVLLVPLVVLSGRKTQLRIAFFLAALTLSYPLLKGLDKVPNDTLVAQAEKISIDRANSLKFRFDNEDLLLERAREKPLFGWGSWGRNQLHDPVTGDITTVSDGRWIIVFGMFGWFGFIAEFGLLVLPIFLLWRLSPHIAPENLSPLVGPMALVLGINIFDLLPNATLTPITWLLSGSLLGYTEYLKNKTISRPEIHARWKPIMR
ncbi:MAG: hypothetical protein GY952_17885 [Rhodobacteraceae bacterium]|nr:hypothetical protein [Paracoccaceae bacterium]